MTKSSLRERFARLGPVRDVDRNRSGSPVEFVLRPARARIETISATRVLAKRGLSKAGYQPLETGARVLCNS